MSKYLPNTVGKPETYEPQMYLSPGSFVTGFDGPHNADYGLAQYNRTRASCEEYKSAGGYAYISLTGVWGLCKPGCHTETYEKLGYHARTREVLQAILDSGIPFVVSRWTTGRVWIVGSEPK